MTDINPWIVAILLSVTALATSTAAVIGTLSHRLQRRKEKLEAKRDVLRRIVGNRFYLTEGANGVGPDGEPFVALNEAAVVYHDDSDAITALKKFHKSLSGQNISRDLPVLIGALSKSAKVDYKIGTYFISRPFTPPESVLKFTCSCKRQ